MAESIATLYVDIVPSVRGIQGQLGSQLNPQVTAAAKQAGAVAGRAMGKDLASATAQSLKATRTLGKDIATSFAPAVRATQDFISGFRDAQAASSSFTGEMGRLGGEARKLAQPAIVAGQNFTAGFRDAQAAASALTGSMGSLGGVVSKATAPVQRLASESVTAGKNLVAGFRDSQAAASALTGHMGSLGGAIAKVTTPAVNAGKNLVAGFRDSDAAASALTGRMGSLGGAASRALTATKNIGGQTVSLLGKSATAVKGIASNASGAVKTFTSTVSTAFAPVTNRINNAAASVANFGTSAVAAAGTAAAAFGGIAITGGLSRALNIEEAQAKLTGLGNSTKDVEKIMENATAAVTGTAYGLGEAASTAASAVAAGIKPGEELEQVLTTVSNSAAIAGTDMQSMGLIFNSVAARGKLQGDDMLQLMSAGVPVLQFLSKELGVTSAEVSDMVSKGQIDFATFESAMREGVGDAAFAMGKTTTGSFKNMMTSISRFGEKAITPFLPLITGAFQGITAVIDGLGNKLVPTFETAGAVVTAFIGSFSGVEGRLGLIKALDEAGLPIVSKFSRALVTTRDSTLAFVNAFRAGGDEITSSGIPGFFENLGLKARAAIDSVRGIIDAIPAPALAGIGAAIAVVAAKIGALMNSRLVGMFTDLASKIPVVGGLISGLASKFGFLGKILGFLGGPWGMVIGLVVAAVSQSSELQGMLGELGQVVFELGGQLLASLVPLFQQLAATLLPLLVGAFQMAVTVVGELLKAVIPLVTTIISALLPIFTTLIGTVLPPLVQILGVVAQVVGAVLMVAFQAVAWILQTIVVPVLQVVITAIGWLANAILTAIGGALSWFTTTAAPAFGAALSAVGGFFTWLWSSVVVPAWNGIKTAIAVVANWIMTSLVPWVQSALTTVGNVMSWLYTAVVIPVWNGIKVAIAVVVAVVMTIVQGLVWFFQNVVAPMFRWLYANVILPVWNGIRNAISAAWTFIRDSILTPLMNFVRGPLTAAWNWLRNLVATVWGAIRNAVSAAWNWVRNNVLNPLINFVRGPLTNAWNWLKNLVARVWAGIRNAISSAWNWVRGNILQPAINFIRGAVSNSWSFLRDRVGSVWSGIKDAVRSAWNWVRSNVLDPMIRFVKNNVVSAWEKAKSGIETAWNKIKSIVSKPVDFVINTVINSGFIKNFNKVAEKFKIDKIPEISFKGFRTGGYTGDIDKDEVAGVVHGREHVTRAESTRTIEKAAPGYLDRLNKYGASALPTFGHAGHAAHGGLAAGGPGGPGTYLWGPLQNRIYATGIAHLNGSASGYDIGAMARAWNNIGNLTVKHGTGQNQITVGPGAPAGTWGYAWTNGTIRLNTGIPGNMKTGTGAHEVGHVLGLDHAGTNSIMHPMMRGPLWPSAYDRSTIQRIYGGAGKGNPPEGGGGPSILDIAGEIWDKIKDALGFDGLMDRVPGAGFALDLMKGAAKTAFDGFKTFVSKTITDSVDKIMPDWAEGILGKVFGNSAIGPASVPTTVFDGGGWLNKTTDPMLIHHRETKPDAVLTARQFQDMHTLAATVQQGNGTDEIRLSERDRELLEALANRDIHVEMDGRELLRATRTSEARFGRR